MSEKYEIKQCVDRYAVYANASGKLVAHFTDYELARRFVSGDRAIEVLRKLEWSGDYYNFEDRVFRCPACNKAEHDGHAADCELAAVLASVAPPEDK